MNNHATVVTITFWLIGILVMDVIAGVNEDLGKLSVIFMVGILLGWLLLHSNQLGSWIGKGTSGAKSSSSGGLLFT